MIKGGTTTFWEEEEEEGEKAPKLTPFPNTFLRCFGSLLYAVVLWRENFSFSFLGFYTPRFINFPKPNWLSTVDQFPRLFFI